jgi:hypothetical protein
MPIPAANTTTNTTPLHITSDAHATTYPTNKIHWLLGCRAHVMMMILIISKHLTDQSIHTPLNAIHGICNR